MVPRSRGSIRRGGSGAVDEAEIGHPGDPLELLGLDVDEAREHRGEGDVDPDVDLAQLLLDPAGHLVEGCRVRGVDGVRRDGAAVGLGLAPGALEPALAAGQQRDGVATGGEQLRRRAADAAGRAGDDDDSGAFRNLAHSPSSGCR
jgi:hypothetical protein